MSWDRLGRALGTVGQNLGTVANYQAEQQRFEEQQRILDRREQANMQFRQHLEELSMQNSNEQRGLDRQQHADEFDRTETLNRDKMAIDQQRADANDKRVDAQLGLENQRLKLDSDRVDIERDRAATAKTNSADMKQAQAIGGQMRNIGSTITNARRQMQQEVAGAMKAGDWMLKSKPEQDSVLNAIKAKYQPIISSAQKDYDSYSQKFKELTGVDDAGSQYQQQAGGDDLGGPTDTPDTSTDSTEAAPVGGAGQASTVGNDKPPPNYPHAKRGNDGRWYIPDPSRPGKYMLVNQ